LSQTHALDAKNYFKELEEDKIQLISINVDYSRKDILLWRAGFLCIYCVDQVDELRGSFIRPGLYYVECDNKSYMPLRGNGWFNHNMICYCIANKIY
jgi:hypothetical protein